MISFRSWLRAGLEKLTGRRIFRVLPRGVDIFADLRDALPKLQVQNVFDVGAHFGESAVELHAAFPDAKIFCFEPLKATFAQLKAAVHGNPAIHCFQCALSDTPGVGNIVKTMVGEVDIYVLGATGGAPADTEEVAVTTIDKFCAEGGVEQIGYLKIDAEGLDLAVLKGAADMLKGNRIDVIQVEAGMNRRTKLFIHFADFERYLADFGYFLFGLYDQVSEWPTGEANLRRTNMVFISDRVIKANA